MPPSPQYCSQILSVRIAATSKVVWQGGYFLQWWWRWWCKEGCKRWSMLPAGFIGGVTAGGYASQSIAVVAASYQEVRITSRPCEFICCCSICMSLLHSSWLLMDKCLPHCFQIVCRTTCCLCCTFCEHVKDKDAIATLCSKQKLSM